MGKKQAEPAASRFGLKDTVVVLSITHRHGVNYYVAETAELARELLHQYVKDWWEDAPDLGERPEDRDKSIEAYFDSEHGREDEFYEISDPQEITTVHNLEKHKEGV